MSRPQADLVTGAASPAPPSYLEKDPSFSGARFCHSVERGSRWGSLSDAPSARHPGAAATVRRQLIGQVERPPWIWGPPATARNSCLTATIPNCGAVYGSPQSRRGKSKEPPQPTGAWATKPAWGPGPEKDVRRKAKETGEGTDLANGNESMLVRVCARAPG